MTPYVLRNGHMGDAQAKISDLFTEVHELERQLEECKDRLDGSEITHAATLADLRDCLRQLDIARAQRDDTITLLNAAVRGWKEAIYEP